MSPEEYKSAKIRYSIDEKSPFSASLTITRSSDKHCIQLTLDSFLRGPGMYYLGIVEIQDGHWSESEYFYNDQGEIDPQEEASVLKGSRKIERKSATLDYLTGIWPSLKSLLKDAPIPDAIRTHPILKHLD